MKKKLQENRVIKTKKYKDIAILVHAHVTTDNCFA